MERVKGLYKYINPLQRVVGIVRDECSLVLLIFQRKSTLFQRGLNIYSRSGCSKDVRRELTHKIELILSKYCIFYFLIYNELIRLIMSHIIKSITVLEGLNEEDLRSHFSELLTLSITISTKLRIT